MKCTQPCLTYSRIVGYFSEISIWNPGKQAEWKDRKPYKIPTRKEVNDFVKAIRGNKSKLDAIGETIGISRVSGESDQDFQNRINICKKDLL